MLDTVAPVAGFHFADAVPLLGDGGSGSWVTPSGSMLVGWSEQVVLLEELGVVEQRYQAVSEVLAGASVPGGVAGV
jgi:hypothetical protein